MLGLLYRRRLTVIVMHCVSLIRNTAVRCTSRQQGRNVNTDRLTAAQNFVSGASRGFPVTQSVPRHSAVIFRL